LLCELNLSFHSTTTPTNYKFCFKPHVNLIQPLVCPSEKSSCMCTNYN
jgi:hypothetical protein